ncbi:hypothetical protein VE03_03002 [Pseudogymnoascus sp. 23342-1-I1]|nr:hypothetical protein VE03_03002 [Pseudogymnoascus sp. 23342-1-I1]
MDRIARDPIIGHENHLHKAESEARIGRHHLLKTASCETLSRHFTASSTRFDLATAYKNHLGLPYPDCKNVSVCFGCPERAKKSDPHAASMGFRELLYPVEEHMFRVNLDLICDAELFDDHVARMTSRMPSRMAYHVMYLGMAMLQCGLSKREAKEAMKKCQELRDAMKEIGLGLPLAGRIVRHPDVIKSLEKLL